MLRRVALGLIEIDHRVELAARPDLLVHLVAHTFFLGTVVVWECRAAERRQRGGITGNVLGMRAHSAGVRRRPNPAQPLVYARRGVARVADIVDPDQHNHMLDTGHGQHNAVEARQRSHGEWRPAVRIAQQAVADDPTVDYPQA